MNHRLTPLAARLDENGAGRCRYNGLICGGIGDRRPVEIAVPRAVKTMQTWVATQPAPRNIDESGRDSHGISESAQRVEESLGNYARLLCRISTVVIVNRCGEFLPSHRLSGHWARRTALPETWRMHLDA
jgi:hypothetical protein